MSVALITGSCGLVGSEASLFFSKKGFEIVGIDNNTRKFFFGKDGDISWVKSKLKSEIKKYLIQHDIFSLPYILDGLIFYKCHHHL